MVKKVKRRSEEAEDVEIYGPIYAVKYDDDEFTYYSDAFDNVEDARKVAKVKANAYKNVCIIQVLEIHKIVEKY